MSGCENLLDSPNENRRYAAVREKHTRTAKGAYCLETGGLVVGRRLRRAIRKLPILGGVPQPGRLGFPAVITCGNLDTVHGNPQGRPPDLPIDFYLSWMSDLVFAELALAPHIPSREAMMERALALELLPQQNETELDFLVERYMAQRAFPEDKRDDAAHVAIVVLNPFIDALVSWNCRHLANEHNRRRLKALTLGEGYGFKFDIVTPEEVILYG